MCGFGLEIWMSLCFEFAWKMGHAASRMLRMSTNTFEVFPLRKVWIQKGGLTPCYLTPTSKSLISRKKRWKRGQVLHGNKMYAFTEVILCITMFGFGVLF